MFIPSYISDPRPLVPAIIREGRMPHLLHSYHLRPSGGNRDGERKGIKCFENILKKFFCGYRVWLIGAECDTILRWYFTNVQLIKAAVVLGNI